MAIVIGAESHSKSLFWNVVSVYKGVLVIGIPAILLGSKWPTSTLMALFLDCLGKLTMY